MSDRGRTFRTIGWSYVVMWIMFVVLKGKTYYIAPVYPVVIAGGAVWLRGIRAKRWRPLIRWAMPALVVIVGAIAAPLAMPILPVEKMIAYQHALDIGIPRTETSRLAELPQFFADMFGWENMTATVAGVWNALPPEERARAAILANNYGEAGAIDFFGPRYGLPPAISGHMSYYLWGPRNFSGDVLVTIGGNEAGFRRVYGSVKQAATVNSRYAMPDENDLPVFICRNPKVSIAPLWKQTKVYR